MLNDIILGIYLTLYYTWTEIIVPSIVFLIIITPLLWIITKVTQNIRFFE